MWLVTCVTAEEAHNTFAMTTVKFKFFTMLLTLRNFSRGHGCRQYLISQLFNCHQLMGSSSFQLLMHTGASFAVVFTAHQTESLRFSAVTFTVIITTFVFSGTLFFTPGYLPCLAPCTSSCILDYIYTTNHEEVSGEVLCPCRWYLQILPAHWAMELIISATLCYVAIQALAAQWVKTWQLTWIREWFQTNGAVCEFSQCLFFLRHDGSFTGKGWVWANSWPLYWQYPHQMTVHTSCHSSVHCAATSCWLLSTVCTAPWLPFWQSYSSVHCLDWKILQGDCSVTVTAQSAHTAGAQAMWLSADWLITALWLTFALGVQDFATCFELVSVAYQLDQGAVMHVNNQHPYKDYWHSYILWSVQETLISWSTLQITSHVCHACYTIN